MRRYFFGSVLLAAIAATPVAVLFVVLRGNQVNLAAGPETLREATLSLMQTFVVSFDVSVMAMWLPCALLLSRWRNSGEC
jgi:hypothetical protein